MRRLGKTAIAFIVGGALGVAVAFAGPVGEGSQPAPASRPVVGEMSRAQLAEFSKYPVYGLAQPLQGLTLEKTRNISPQVLAEAAASETVPGPVTTVADASVKAASDGHEVVPEFVSMIYGDCDASVLPCAPPLNIQVWRSCNRSLDDYEITPGTPYPHTDLTIRGTKAASFEDRVELYTGSVTIVIFAEHYLAMQAAKAIRPMNARAEAEVSDRAATTTAGANLLPLPDRVSQCT